MFPVLLISLFLGLLLLGISDGSQSLILALFHLCCRHAWHEAEIGVGLACGNICMLGSSILLSLLLRLVVKSLREVQLYGRLVELRDSFQVSEDLLSSK